MSITEQARLAREASIRLAVLSTRDKNKALLEIAKSIKKNSKSIINENKKDIEAAEKYNLNKSLINRLKIDGIKINEIVEEIKSVAMLDDTVGKTLSQTELDKGLMLYQVTCPIGVIAAIFESRPDVVTQISALCLKSGNAVILKGGSEALNSNRILAKLISETAEKSGIPRGSVQLIETREQVGEMLKMHDYIDLIVPRGSNAFVKYIMENSKIPVLGHSEGICHVYVDKYADLKKAIEISLDAKCQYPAVCNAMETLLVNKDIAKRFLPLMAEKFRNADVELRGDEETVKIVKNIKKASKEDWDKEYNDLILSVKVVNDVQEAIGHINRHGSRHTDAIITENRKNAEDFMSLVDSASVMWNASTRFADGFRYGKGAEVGISTSKIHARGPVGLEGLVIYKYKLIGKGHVVGDYTGKKARKFRHKIIKKRL